MKKDILERKIESLKLPDVEVPSHKRRLLSELLESNSFKKQKGSLFVNPPKIIYEVIYMFTHKWKYIVPTFAMVFVFLTYLSFFSAPKAMAYLTLQVNPALELSINKDNNVIDIKSLNEDAASLLTGLEVKNKNYAQALREITSEMISRGFVKPDREFFVALRPVNKEGEVDLTALSASAQSAIKESLDTAKLDVKITNIVVPQDLYDFAKQEGLLPSAYAELIEENVTPETVSRILSLKNEQNIEPAIYKKEFHTIVSSLSDMIEAGMSETSALSVLTESIKADPSLEELTTITAAVVDMHKAGISSDSALKLLSLGKESGVDSKIFLEEITTLTSALIDSHEAGISADAAVLLIKDAIKANPSLEEISTITAALIDLKEEGVEEEEALKKIKAAIEADPTLEQLDDLIEDDLNKNEEADPEYKNNNKPAQGSIKTGAQTQGGVIIIKPLTPDSNRKDDPAEDDDD